MSKVAPGVTRTYRVAMAVARPIIRSWGRLEVEGLEHLPESGPVLVAANHDSYWDPLAIGLAGLPRRQIQALAKAELWSTPGLGPILNGMGQIPIDRGKGDAHAMDRALAELADGACIGIFPEGTRSRARELRARAGIGRLAQDVDGTRVVCCTVAGTVDVIRVPKRPQVRVRFFPPEGGQIQAGESPAEFSVRLLAEIRREAPIVPSGRSKEANRQLAGEEEPEDAA